MCNKSKILLQLGMHWCMHFSALRWPESDPQGNLYTQRLAGRPRGTQHTVGLVAKSYYTDGVPMPSRSIMERDWHNPEKSLLLIQTSLPPSAAMRNAAAVCRVPG